MRDLVKLYFKDKDIVNHHVESFNDFLANVLDSDKRGTEKIVSENQESRMQHIVDDIRVPTDDAERGVIKLDPERTNGRDIEIRIGRKKDKNGTPSGEPTIRVHPPEVTEANGYKHKLTPMEARLRNLNYMSSVEVRFEVYEDGVRKDIPDDGWVHIGEIPMMVKSNGCNLNRTIMEQSEDKTLTQAEYDQKLIEAKEDPREPGGYFIIGGTERVLITLEDLAPNRIMVEYSERYGTAVETAKVFSQKEGYRALTQVEKKKDGILMVSVPAVPQAIPLVALMKALGMESDKEIHDLIYSDDGMELTIMANIENSFNTKDYPPNGFHTQDDAIAYLERTFAQGQAKEYRIKKVESILDRSLLPHLGDSREDRKKKAIFLGRIAKSVLELSLKKRKEDDKDHYANKRLKLSGDLMEDLFRTSFTSLIKDLKYQLERNFGRKKADYNIASSIRPDLFTHKLIHALATGNWVGGRAGVSQLLDRTSNMSAMSHLRRITSSLTRSQPHFEARDLHPTQWGRLCPSETPEGQNCGLVKNAALIIDVSHAVPDQNVYKRLKELGLETVNEEETRVFLNGDLVGCSRDPQRFVDAVRGQRRIDALLTSNNTSNTVNIHYDTEMNEIIINCDDGRLRRPLLVLRDGKTVLTRTHVEQIRETLQGNCQNPLTWDDLFKNGVMEWIDAEEEEDAYVLVSPYDLPNRCPCCNHALSETDVDWMNPGKAEDCVLTCRWCSQTFTLPSKITTEHTHLEVDPMIILGVAAGIVPYPEHNSAPRVTMGAGMAKQALGISTANYRIRPDTRGHLMHYPQVPMVQTQTMDFMGYKYRPAGQNFCIAVMCYHGYNIEDAIVMNKSSVQRGLGRSTFMRSYRAEERLYPGGDKDHFTNLSDVDVTGMRDEEKYENLDEDGLISPESFVQGSDVLIGKISPPRFMEDENAGVLSTHKYRETSVTVRPGEKGYVDSVIVTASENGSRLVRVKVRDERIPELGDKFCSRFGQKGVVGRLVDQWDMPFTSSGITPDIVVNPHGIPSRMTVGHVLEMIAGKVGSMEARTIDGTAFSGESEDSIRDGLVRNGFTRSGKEIMYDGRTGHMVEADIYTGVIFYEKLHHMVSGKLHYRSRGPVQILTRQPTEGRSRQGGLRFGEMERDCLIGHGVAMVIKDRLLDQSDGTQQYVCSECGHIAIQNRQGERHCPVCNKPTRIHLIQTSYAFKLLMDELLSLGVAMRLQLGDLS